MYDKNQVVNWGYNRWSLTNQFAWTSEVLSEKLTMDIDYDFTYYGNNNDFGAASQTLEQDILHHLQLHWAYDVTPALALTTSYQYLWGGETTISDFRPPPIAKGVIPVICVFLPWPYYNGRQDVYVLVCRRWT